jgi:hypothetical protein
VRPLASLLRTALSRAPCAPQGWDLLFSGDSVLEFLRGSVVGRPWGALADDVQAFHDQIATHYNAHILAISGRLPRCPALSQPLVIRKLL